MYSRKKRSWKGTKGPRELESKYGAERDQRATSEPRGFASPHVYLDSQETSIIHNKLIKRMYDEYFF